MMHLLAQTGGGGGGIGNWLSPGVIKGLFYAVVIFFAIFGSIIKKANEKRIQRQAEQAKQRREEESLRTGRPMAENSDMGGSVDLPNVASPTMKQATAEDARRKLQELAERRRRELAEMMRRAQQGQNPSPSAGSPAPRPTPPIAAPPQPRPQPQPQMRPTPQRAPNMPMPQARPMQDVEARRKREADAKRTAANKTAAREKAEGLKTAKLETAGRKTRDAENAVANAAYDLPATPKTGATAARAGAGGGSVGAALARVGTGAKTDSASEWRKAVVLSELLHRPVGMREDGERVI